MRRREQEAERQAEEFDDDADTDDEEEEEEEEQEQEDSLESQTARLRQEAQALVEEELPVLLRVPPSKALQIRTNRRQMLT